MSYLTRPLAWHRPLSVFAIAMMVVILVATTGLILDDRTVLGEPNWLKPFKFAVSLTVFGFTWSWLFSLHPNPPRKLWRVASALVVASGVEIVIICIQAARGRRSHFNFETTLDTWLFNTMGLFVAVLGIGTAVTAYLLSKQKLADPAMNTALRFGMGVSVAGVFVAVLMQGEHSVGVPDGGPGLPITHWNTTGGDLRVPHFIGMHALQVVPLFAVAIATLVGRELVRARLIRVFGWSYACLLALVTWQALRGQSLVHPDGLTLAAAGLIALGTAAGAVWTLRTSSPELTETRT